MGLYGLYVALYVPPLLVGNPSPLILVVTVAEAVTAIIAAVAVWMRAAWALGAVLLFAAAIVSTQLVEGPVLGLIANLRAIFIGVVAVLVALAIAAYVRTNSAIV